MDATASGARVATTRVLRLERLGRCAYEDALVVQTARRDEVLAGADDRLILVEHMPVITIGRGGDEAHVLRAGIPVVRVSRGGDVTYHGPGQLVGYPIVDLAPRGTDIHRYLRDLEEVLIEGAARFGVVAGRRAGFTGVWIGHDKLAAIGIGVRRGVTMHGFALNVADVREPFSAIVPCGLAGTGVTSLEQASGTRPLLAAVEATIAAVFAAHFGYDAVVETHA